MKTRNRNISYTGKNFDDFRSQLIEFARNYFPDSYSDFSEASPGMMFIEMASYVGDVLSFYGDIQLQETFLEYAKNPANLYAIAYMMGYRPKVTSVSEVELTVTQEIPAKEVGSGSYEPDWEYAARLPEYTQIRSNSRDNVSFLLKEPLDFSFSSSYNPTEVVVVEREETTRLEEPAVIVPDHYEITKKAKAFSGELRTTTRHFGTYEKFPTIEIKDSNIVGIIKVKKVGDDTEEWVEVPTLGQDTIFSEEVNENSERDRTRYILTLKKVPRRFTTRFTLNRNLQVQFGAGADLNDSAKVPENENQSILPNPILLEPGVQDTILEHYDTAYDPSNFLFSKSYGVVPINEDLEFTYIVGGGLQSNVPAYTISELGTGFSYTYPNATQAISSRPVIRVINEKASTGGRSGDSLEEVRQNALKAFAEQKRVVTLKDFTVRSLSMPQKFGNISKVYATKEPLSEKSSILSQNPLAITLYVLGQDAEGHLSILSDTVKNNLKTYLSQYMMITDAVDIRDAFVVNFKIRYDITLRPGFVAQDVLLKCDQKIEEYFRLDRRSINQPIMLTDLYTILDRVTGVQTVSNIVVSNIYDPTGEKYSKYSYDMEAATKNRVVYPSYDPCIFELKYPGDDISGRAITY